MPSERDGMVTVKKSMSCGLPPIVTEHKGMPVDELGENNITHMPIKPDESTIANSISQLIENSSLRQQLSMNARQHCLGQLSLEKSWINTANCTRMRSSEFRNHTGISLAPDPGSHHLADKDGSCL